jgi:hypothetical protein
VVRLKGSIATCKGSEVASEEELIVATAASLTASSLLSLLMLPALQRAPKATALRLAAASEVAVGLGIPWAYLKNGIGLIQPFEALACTMAMLWRFRPLSLPATTPEAGRLAAAPLAGQPQPDSGVVQLLSRTGRILIPIATRWLKRIFAALLPQVMPAASAQPRRMQGWCLPCMPRPRQLRWRTSCRAWRPSSSRLCSGALPARCMRAAKPWCMLGFLPRPSTVPGTRGPNQRRSAGKSQLPAVSKACVTQLAGKRRPWHCEEIG